jgi:outer membrane murein-binding lipoprotein Lpp
MASVIYADNGGSHMFSRRHVTGGALLALVLLAAIPVAADARTFKVDGRVTGPPTAKGGAVTVSFKLTKRAGRALKLGTRRVRVRFRRARLPLSGAAGVRRLAPRALRAGDRLKGVTSLSKKGRLRLRYRARPTLKLKRPRVIRRVRRSRGAPLPPSSAVPLARTPEQIVRDIGARATTLSGRIGAFGSFSQQIGRLETLRLPVGLAGVTVAFESLTAALEGRSGTDAAFAPLLAEVEALAPGAEWLGPAMGAVETSLGAWRTLAMIGDAVETLALEAPFLAAQIELLTQIPGVLAQITAIEELLMRIEGRLDAVEAASGSFSSSTSDVNAGMASLTDAVNALATDVEAGADLASTSAGVDSLATDVAGLASRFGALQTSVDQYAPALDGLNADAVALEAMVEGLEAWGMGGG